MNKLLYLFLSFLIIGCSMKDSNSETLVKENLILVEQDISDLLVSIKEPYSISFEMNEHKKGEYDLYVSLELDSGYYFMSPLSKGHSPDRLAILLEHNDFIHLDSAFIETSNTLSENSSADRDEILWVRKNTTYKLRLSLETTEDFKISGFVEFMLQPENRLKEIEFVLSKNSDQLQVLKVGHKNLMPTEIMHMKTGAYIKGY